MRLVISQSMYFPWVGLLEQWRLADVFMHYDDVQYARGLFNRVQIKTKSGIRWLTVPLRDHHRGQNIDEVVPDDRQDWRGLHRRLLEEAYRECPYREEMLAVYDTAAASPAKTLADVARASMDVLANYLGLGVGTKVVESTGIATTERSSERLLALCTRMGADTYITGHGARHYLDHALFEAHGIRVEYMDYQCKPYPQQHGDFTPYVSALDLIANCGAESRQYLCSGSVHWKEFIDASE